MFQAVTKLKLINFCRFWSLELTCVMSKERLTRQNTYHTSGPSHYCQVSKLFSGQYTKKVRQISQNNHCSLQPKGQLKIKILNFVLPLRVCHYWKIRNFFRQFPSAPFLPLLAKFGKNSATDSSGQLFSPGPFWAFWPEFCPPGNISPGGLPLDRPLPHFLPSLFRIFANRITLAASPALMLCHSQLATRDE